MEVPVVVDEKTTLRLADSVNDLLRKMEATSTRIDTQLFALQAAFHFASEAEVIRMHADGVEKEVATQLDLLMARLQQAVTEEQQPILRPLDD